jgi:hypothetical protein
MQRPLKSSNKTFTMLKRMLSLLLVLVTALFKLTGAVSVGVVPADNTKPTVEYIDWAAESISRGPNRRMFEMRGGRGPPENRGPGRGRGSARGDRH